MLEHPLFPVVVVLALATLSSILLVTLVSSLRRGRYAWQRRLREQLGVDLQGRLPELFWFEVLLLLVLWAGVLLFTLQHLQEGRGIADILHAALTGGFSVGGFTINPLRILIAVVSFLVMLTLSRWVTRKMERDWLVRAGMAPQGRYPTARLVAYCLLFFALLVALSVAGIDFGKLALIAGALSVGIGFGLQTIVSNFVSGLILLFERPVKVGDFISVGQTTGFVRQIRMRFTEIETWDRESIIVPNSELLTHHVKNLNFKDDTGRITIGLPMAHGVDTDRVRDLLLEVAASHPQVLAEGEVIGTTGPMVLFREFTHHGLQFELRVYLRDVSQRLVVGSELRFAINKSLREHGIAVPHQQSDVWLRRWPDGEAAQLLSESASER